MQDYFHNIKNAPKEKKIEIWNNIEKAFWDSGSNPEEILKQFVYGNEDQRRKIMVKFFSTLDWYEILEIIPYKTTIKYLDDKTIEMLFPEATKNVYRNIQFFLKLNEGALLDNG